MNNNKENKKDPFFEVESIELIKNEDSKIDLKSKKGLGRGLSSLLGDTTEKIQTNKVPIYNIVRNKFQPRKHFSKESLEELSSSIKEQGVIQPIIVRPDKDSKNKYDEIIPLCSINLYSKNPESELLDYIDKGVKGVGELHLNYDEEIEKPNKKIGKGAITPPGD